MKRGQLISLDMIAGTILFIIFVGLFLLILIIVPQYGEETQFDQQLLFAHNNLESNLQSLPEEQRFYANYRIDKLKLEAYLTSNPSGEDFDNLVLGSTEFSEGLGLSPDGHDVCMYLQVDSTPIELQSSTTPAATNTFAVGGVNSGSCSSIIIAGNSPCENYRQAMTLFKPILLDYGNIANNEIVQMNLVVCKT